MTLSAPAAAGTQSEAPTDLEPEQAPEQAPPVETPPDAPAEGSEDKGSTPDAPKDKVTFDGLLVPEGSPMTESHLNSIREYADKHDLSLEAAQGLADQQHAQLLEQQAIVDRDWEARHQGWKQALQSDPSYGGDHFDENEAFADAAVTRFWDAGFADELKKSGFWFHPELKRGFAKLGAAMSEPTSLVNGDPAARSPQAKRGSHYPNSPTMDEASGY